MTRGLTVDDPKDETTRDMIERSRRGAPAAGDVVQDKLETYEVFQRIVAVADEEATRGPGSRSSAASRAGFAITVTFLLYAALTAGTGGDPVFSAVLYPLGFVFIIQGGYQLYTENTLPP